jgi:hypothetical protein
VLTIQQLTDRYIKEFLGSPILDNTLRGYWLEVMLAEALGPRCRLVSAGWHLWDLQFGPSDRECPARIRIQVRNTAALQTWSKGVTSACQWILASRPAPAYFGRDHPHVPCESAGYLCDVFILAHHPGSDPTKADHRDPYQWRFFVVPVTPRHRLFPLDIPYAAGRDRWSYIVRPETLERGIRGRPPVPAVSIDMLSERYIREQLNRTDFLLADERTETKTTSTF